MVIDGDATVGTWKREGNKVTLTAIDGTDTDVSELEIKTLNSSSLTLYYKETDTDYFYESTMFLKR